MRCLLQSTEGIKPPRCSRCWCGRVVGCRRYGCSRSRNSGSSSRPPRRQPARSPTSNRRSTNGTRVGYNPDGHITFIARTPRPRRARRHRHRLPHLMRLFGSLSVVDNVTDRGRHCGGGRSTDGGFSGAPCNGTFPQVHAVSGRRRAAVCKTACSGFPNSNPGPATTCRDALRPAGYGRFDPRWCRPMPSHGVSSVVTVHGRIADGTSGGAGRDEGSPRGRLGVDPAYVMLRN